MLHENLLKFSEGQVLYQSHKFGVKSDGWEVTVTCQASECHSREGLYILLNQTPVSTIKVLECVRYNNVKK